MKTEEKDSAGPGYCNEEAIWHVDKRLFRQMGEFISPQDMLGTVGDVGTLNAKSRFMAHRFNSDIKQIEANDFNFNQLTDPFDTVLCFEVIEHLANPLYFMSQVSQITDCIYLSTPCRPQFLWTEHHFIEYSPARLKKWILEPLGLQIVRKKYLHINHHWSFYLKGIRPFFRLFLGWTVIYEIKSWKSQ